MKERGEEKEEKLRRKDAFDGEQNRQGRGEGGGGGGYRGTFYDLPVVGKNHPNTRRSSECACQRHRTKAAHHCSACVV
jgi:hypothetical protein